MLVCGIKKVYENLEKSKIEKIYLTKEFNDKDILDFISLINKDEEVIEIEYVKREDIKEMIDEEIDVHQDIVGQLKSRIPIIIILIISIMLLMFISIGLAFSIKTGEISKPGVDTDVGKIVLNYSDVGGNGPGIYIKNALPISDDVGKSLMGTGNYFDFTVSGSTGNIPLKYFVLIEENENSTLDDDQVKIYLTKLNGTIEEQILLRPFKISELNEIDDDDDDQEIIYIVDIDEKQDKFVDNYRLRIWVSDDAKDYFDKMYSLKINILGKGR